MVSVFLFPNTASLPCTPLPPSFAVVVGVVGLLLIACYIPQINEEFLGEDESQLTATTRDVRLWHSHILVSLQLEAKLALELLEQALIELTALDRVERQQSGVSYPEKNKGWILLTLKLLVPGYHVFVLLSQIQDYKYSHPAVTPFILRPP